MMITFKSRRRDENGEAQKTRKFPINVNNNMENAEKSIFSLKMTFF